MRYPLLFCLLPVVAIGIPAQTVHIVGPGGLPQIASALAVAVAGDVIHVMPGTYAPFTISIGCTIRGLVPGSVFVTDMPLQNVVEISVPAGQVVHLAGLVFGGQLSTSITGGRVTLDQCTLRSSSYGPLQIMGADVHFQSCVVASDTSTGSSPGINAHDARITAVDSEFSGSPTTPFVYFASPGILMSNTILHASGCTLRGGLCPNFAAPAVSANGGAVWLSDSTAVGNLSCPVTATSWLADRCILQPALANCPTPSGELLGVTRAQPLENGATFSLTYKTIPNSYAAVFASQELASLTIPGLHAQTQWLGPGILNLGLVFADTAGEATATWTIPASPFLVDQPLWFQGLTGFTLPLQLSPVTGGLIR